jgi:hypothetical protein
MSKIKRFIHPSLFVLLFIISSCARYVDTGKYNSSEQIKYEFFRFFPDSNIFKYKSNVVLTRDTEKIYLKNFEVKLPKKIRYYELIGTTDFTFYYDKSQVIFIKVDHENKNIKQDTVYTPSKDQLNEIIDSEVKTESGKYDLKDIPFKEHRKNLIIQRGTAMILLCNIYDYNFPLFFEYVNSFKFIN